MRTSSESSLCGQPNTCCGSFSPVALLWQGRAFTYTSPLLVFSLLQAWVSSLGVHTKPTATLASLELLRPERRPCAHVVIKGLPLRNEAAQWKPSQVFLTPFI